MSLVQSYFKQPTKPKRKWRRPLKPVSEKRRATNVIRRAEAESTFGRFPECQACAPLARIGISRWTTGCNGWADDLHEVLSRARSGLEDNLTDMAGCVPTSRACHDFVTTHPCEAEDAGLASRSGPVTQPLRSVDPRTGARP